MPDLLAELNNNPNPTEEMVHLYLHERIAQGVINGATMLSIADFWQPGDLELYYTALAWWPKDAPMAHARPYLGVLCRGIAAHAPLHPVPFRQALTDMGERCAAWLTANDRNVVNPNETPAERKRRKGREAVARHRKLHGTSPENPQAIKLKQLHAAYIEACQARKAAAAEHDSAVAAAKAAWETAKAELG